jgi:hypothetical protein
MTNAFSPQEASAFQTMIGWGFDQLSAAAYIGRARRWFNCGSADSKAKEASSPLKSQSNDQILDYALESIKFDEGQKAFLERTYQHCAETHLIDWLASHADDPHIENFEKILRDLVESERAKIASAQPASGRGEIFLYPQNQAGNGPNATGEGRIGARLFKVSGRLEHDGAGREFFRISLIPK